jgi:hypothetical protein
MHCYGASGGHWCANAGALPPAVDRRSHAKDGVASKSSEGSAPPGVARTLPSTFQRETVVAEGSSVCASHPALRLDSRADGVAPEVVKEGGAEAVGVALCALYVAHGGVSEDHAIVLRMRRLYCQPLSVLARWIVDREVISFQWRGATLLPDFQFDPSTWQPRPCVGRVVRELLDVYDDLELARWFVNPNVWLDGRLPADVVVSSPDDVFEAAGKDRFVAGW